MIGIELGEWVPADAAVLRYAAFIEDIEAATSIIIDCLLSGRASARAAKLRNPSRHSSKSRADAKPSGGAAYVEIDPSIFSLIAFHEFGEDYALWGPQYSTIDVRLVGKPLDRYEGVELRFLYPHPGIVTSSRESPDAPRSAGAPRSAEKWRDFWFRVVDLALNGQLNPADLGKLGGLTYRLIDTTPNSLSARQVQVEVRAIWDRYVEPSE